jgi:divalent metal cation (Fe/Co/Zn/Cd) transporter
MEATRAGALRLGVRLEIVTIGWMAVEAVVAIGGGVLARSVLLTAFGIDSIVELMSGLVLFRLLTGRSGETAATRFSGLLLALLCVYVLMFSIAGLLLRIEPEASPAGIAVSAVAVVAMPLLAIWKRRVNEVLKSTALRADIAESISCAYLAAITVGGLVVSMVSGWWWVQYLAALGLLVWLVPETLETLRGSSPDLPHERGGEE